MSGRNSKRHPYTCVVFHEMLHHEMPAVVQNGRRHYHTAAFRKRERTFEYHAAAEQWQKENLWRLLRRPK